MAIQAIQGMVVLVPLTLYHCLALPMLMQRMDPRALRAKAEVEVEGPKQAISASQAQMSSTETVRAVAGQVQVVAEAMAGMVERLAAVASRF
jgi:hypothetical protein